MDSLPNLQKLSEEYKLAPISFEIDIPIYDDETGRYSG